MQKNVCNFKLPRVLLHLVGELAPHELISVKLDVYITTHFNFTKDQQSLFCNPAFVYTISLAISQSSVLPLLTTILDMLLSPQGFF